MKKKERSLYLWHCLQEVYKESSWEKESIYLKKKKKNPHDPADSCELDGERESAEGKEEHAFKTYVYGA